MKKIFIIVALVAGLMVSAQVKIGDNVGTINANSILELESTNKGVLVPRVALTSTTSFAPLTGVQFEAATGMTVYNTATTGDVTPGMYTWSGAAWVRLGASSSFVSATLTKNASYTALATADVTPNNITTLIFSGGSPTNFTITDLPIGNIGKILNIYISGNGTASINVTFKRSGDSSILTAQTLTNTKGYSFVWDGTGWSKTSY